MKHDLNVMLFFDKSKKNKFQFLNSKFQPSCFFVHFRNDKIVINWNLNLFHKKSLEFLQGFKFLGG